MPTLVVIDREGIVRYMSCGVGEPGLFQLALAGVVGAKYQQAEPHIANGLGRAGPGGSIRIARTAAGRRG